MTDHIATRHTGSFVVSEGSEVVGDLTINGPHSSLYLHDKEFFSIGDLTTIHGVLHDRTKVSLIDCVLEKSGSRSRGEKYSFEEVFPHFILLGDVHVRPGESVIEEVQFLIDDAAILFHDPDAFGVVLDATQYIESIVRAREARVHRTIRIGTHPIITYFAANREIFSISTVIGRVSASHSPHARFPGPSGVGINDAIWITIRPTDHTTFDNAIVQMSKILQFTGLLVGRRQILKKIRVKVSTGVRAHIIDVHCNRTPLRDQSGGTSEPQPGSSLIRGAMQPDAFGEVLAQWLGGQPERGEARGRFFDCFARQFTFGVDRVVAAANMFDLLPPSEKSDDWNPTQQLAEAIERCRDIFRSLDDDSERTSAIRTLDWLNGSSLRRKVHSRVEIIDQAIVGQLPDLRIVCDQAIDCRNRYVHGPDSRRRIDFENLETLAFLTATLEFVFGVSELIEAGWDIGEWWKRGGMDHPFGHYTFTYSANHARLMRIIGGAKG